MAKTTNSVKMAKTGKTGKRELESYTIRGTNNKVVKVGEAVLMRASDNDSPPYVALIESIEADSRNNIKVKVRWYYRPEESTGGRKQFHGSKEVFLSDHYDFQSADTIEETCVVHSLTDYTNLDKIGDEDYYCRFEYKSATGAFNPDRVVVYCKCEMPYNPDDLMVQCEGCREWYHPVCVNLTIEAAKLLDNFMCAECASAAHLMKSEHSSPSSTVSNSKVETKRRKK